MAAHHSSLSLTPYLWKTYIPLEAVDGLVHHGTEHFHLQIRFLVPMVVTVKAHDQSEQV